MQQTYYSVMKEVQKGHWMEQTPRPRSKRAALAMGEVAAAEGHHVTVDRHVSMKERVKTFNKPLTTR